MKANPNDPLDWLDLNVTVYRGYNNNVCTGTFAPSFHSVIETERLVDQLIANLKITFQNVVDFYSLLTKLL